MAGVAEIAIAATARANKMLRLARVAASATRSGCGKRASRGTCVQKAKMRTFEAVRSQSRRSSLSAQGCGTHHRVEIECTRRDNGDARLRDSDSVEQSRMRMKLPVLGTDA